MSSTWFKSLLQGSAALLTWGNQSNISLEDKRVLNDWWTNEHLPERLAMEGFHRVRRCYYSSSVTSDASSKSDTESRGESKGSTSHYLVLYDTYFPGLHVRLEQPHALDNEVPARTRKHEPFRLPCAAFPLTP